MTHRICEECLRDYEIEKHDGFPFPSFTVVGGIVGGIIGLATGAVFLVPAGLFAGLTTDAIRCEQCGSDKGKIYQFLIETEDMWGEKRYEPIVRSLNENPRQYRYDELEGRFTPVEKADQSVETTEIDMQLPDISVDYEVSFDVADASLEVGTFGSEMGGIGDGSGDSGSGEGGSAAGGGSGGGE